MPAKHQSHHSIKRIVQMYIQLYKLTTQYANLLFKYQHIIQTHLKSFTIFIGK